jgi:surface antigen
MKNTMKVLTKVVILSVSVLTLSSCSNQLNRAQSGAGIGAASGAIVGQIIGRSTGATLIGAAVGTMAGYIVGNEMDKYDNQQLGQVYERGIPGQTTTWRNPNSGHMHHVTPQAAVRTDSGICRTAEIESTIDGRREMTLATACRDDYGRWVIQS